MAKWYRIVDDALKIKLKNVDLCTDIILSPQGPSLWCIRFEYALPGQNVDEETARENFQYALPGQNVDEETAYENFEVMKMLFDRIVEWLDSDTCVFHHDDELEKCRQKIAKR